MRPEPFRGWYAGRTVLVTGHTGFVGWWVTRFLAGLGATVVGLSRKPGHPAGSSPPGLIPVPADITDPAAVAAALATHQPEVLLHLAGQAIVGASVRDPLATFTANVTGTAVVLDAALRHPSVRSLVAVSSPAAGAGGGSDPYTASKRAAEAVATGYTHPPTQRAAGREQPLAIGIARPGVMIGGGPGGSRLLDDVVHAVGAGRPVTLRGPASVRPWQHVLEAVSGMLTLAWLLATAPPPQFAYDFGRLSPAGCEPVAELVAAFLAAYGEPDWPVSHAGDGAGDRTELGCAAAAADLGWRPAWELSHAVAATARWYRASGERSRLAAVAEETIGRYLEFAEKAGAAWAGPG